MATPYDSIADWYANKVQTDATGVGNWALPTFLDLIGEAQGQQVCDLGCGEGRLARLLAQRGAQVMGIDSSAALVTAAQQREDAQPLGIRYCIEDAQSLRSIGDATFDGVACSLALMDIPNLAATFHTVWRVLRPGGWFAFLITHPCFAAPHAQWHTGGDGHQHRDVGIYLTEGFWSSPQGGTLCSQVGAQHRTLTTYINTLVNSGFTINRVIEPQATGPALARNPGYAEIPCLFLLKATK